MRKSTLLLPDSESVALCAIFGLHPVVLAMIQEHAPEPLPRVNGLSKQAVERAFRVPQLGLMPEKDGAGYWCVTGIREYRFLVQCGFRIKVACNIFRRLRDAEIAELAETDLYIRPYMGAPCPRILRPHAKIWEQHSPELCRSDEPGLNGADLLAGLLCLDKRRFTSKQSAKIEAESVTLANATNQPKGRAA